MRSFTNLTAFAIAAVSLTAAAPAPVAELNARLFPFVIPMPIPSNVPTKAVEVKLGPLSLAVRQLENAPVPTAIAQAHAAEQFAVASAIEANPTVSAAIASATAVGIPSIANEASAAAPVPAASSLPPVAARQIIPPPFGLAILEGAGLAAGVEGAALQGEYAHSVSAPPPAFSPVIPPIPSTNVRRQNNNPLDDDGDDDDAALRPLSGKLDVAGLTLLNSGLPIQVPAISAASAASSSG
jgi:hypothetical protein